ncbi:MAG: enoyl-CoA hydratase/isomerase family protein [Magnetospiraceae bacterium]
MSNLVLTDRQDSIMLITLNNPEKRNALSLPMWRDLHAAIGAVSEDDTVRAVILRGAGDKAFAAGADITEFDTVRGNREQARLYDKALRDCLEAIRACRPPTIAAIQGACMGAGLEIAVQCDFRISGESGLFGAPIKLLGLAMTSPEIEGIYRLVGPAVTREILLEGRIFKAQEACAKGIVTRVTPDAGLMEEAFATAGRIADGAPLTARWHKAFLNQLEGASKVTAEDIEAGYFYFETDDFWEGVNAFKEKRKPKFTGS